MEGPKRMTLTALLLATATPVLAAQIAPVAGRMEDGPRGTSIGTGVARVKAFARTNGLSYHNGPVLVSAKAVFIFWGPTFANPASPDYAYAQAQIGFRKQLGTSQPYSVITQYYQVVGGVKQYIELTNLAGGTADWFDTTNPPTAVTDADVQGEVSRYLLSNTFDADTIYQVFIPSTSYSTDGGEDSCGGPNLAYCAYHGYFVSGSDEVVYSIEPYPSCSGCQWPNYTAAENQEHFICHETRESVTDPLFTGWWSTTTGSEGDSLCGWAGGFTMPEICGETWSNAANKCVS